ncbi:MAG: hypothetical protein ACKV2U_32215 [Bryobacteraceae bacterium]
MFRITLLAFAALLRLNAASPEVTVIIQLGEVFSPQAWQAMEAETGRIAKQAGIRLQFVEHSKAAGKEFDDLVVFRMKGRCAMNAFPAPFDERGPYASAAVAGGNVLPFGEVRCDRIRESLKTAMAGRDFAQGDELLGRALGRVVAHELYHMLANTRGHSKSGVAKEALSARQLLSDDLSLADHDCAVLSARRDFR